MEQFSNCQLLKVIYEIWNECCGLFYINFTAFTKLSGQFGLSRCLKHKHRPYAHPTNCCIRSLNTTRCPLAKVNAHMTVHADLDSEC